jgi:CheY-like chemotaxis protein/anti-sigma regulatory factor (Ser/Thr protein kinase)
MAAGEALLHALLDISTLDAGVIQVDVKDVHALPCVTAVAREFEAEAQARSISLKVMGAEDFIQTDPLLLGQIVRNLLSNALRYTPDGGRVLVACRRRREELVIEVWDTGQGIPEDMQEAIFEDFVQVANPERDRRKGLGLGLGIVRRTAKLLGCSLSLRSRPGRGSVFAIAFPKIAAADPPNVVRLPGNTGSRRQEPFRVLLIEDDTLQLMALQFVLEDWGYAVMAAPTAEEAFAALAGSAVLPGLIISDFRLPGEINGVQAVARICNEARRHIPAIIVTGDTAPERIKEAAATGCQLLHKPYDPAVLKTTIDALTAPEPGTSLAPPRVGSGAPPER